MIRVDFSKATASGQLLGADSFVVVVPDGDRSRRLPLHKADAMFAIHKIGVTLATIGDGFCICRHQAPTPLGFRIFVNVKVRDAHEDSSLNVVQIGEAREVGESKFPDRARRTCSSLDIIGLRGGSRKGREPELTRRTKVPFIRSSPRARARFGRIVSGSALSKPRLWLTGRA